MSSVCLQEACGGEGAEAPAAQGTLAGGGWRALPADLHRHQGKGLRPAATLHAAPTAVSMQRLLMHEAHQPCQAELQA